MRWITSCDSRYCTLPATRKTLRNRVMCEYHAGVEDGAEAERKKNVDMIEALAEGSASDTLKMIAGMIREGRSVIDAWDAEKAATEDQNRRY